MFLVLAWYCSFRHFNKNTLKIRSYSINKQCNGPIKQSRINVEVKNRSQTLNLLHKKNPFTCISTPHFTMGSAHCHSIYIWKLNSFAYVVNINTASIRTCPLTSTGPAVWYELILIPLVYLLIQLTSAKIPAISFYFRFCFTQYFPRRIFVIFFKAECLLSSIIRKLHLLMSGKLSLIF